MDEDAQEETRRIHEEMTFAAIELLRAVIAVDPPFSVVFTVCASIIAAERVFKKMSDERGDGP
jgi:hypothetical protein